MRLRLSIFMPCEVGSKAHGNSLERPSAPSHYGYCRHRVEPTENFTEPLMSCATLLFQTREVQEFAKLVPALAPRHPAPRSSGRAPGNGPFYVLSVSE
jgi:hypothetical protein